MSVQVTMDWKYCDLKTIIIDNEFLRIVIIPELGAKIWQITYKPLSKEMLWNHPRIKPRALPFNSVYDDVFFGGWDELFPNDIMESLNGEQEPDHGEIWTLPWNFRIVQDEEDEVGLYLWVDTPISACRVEKWIHLKAGESKIRFRHRITNQGHLSQPYLWKLHAALAVNENCRIEMGADTMYVENFGPTRTGQSGVGYSWPYWNDEKGIRHDMRKVLPVTARINEFQYATSMHQGWCSVTDTQSKLGFGLSFDLNTLPSCWLFASYGGWRNLHTVVLEPCTGYPISVQEGVLGGTHRVLQPGESLETWVTAVVYEGVESVASIDPEGNITEKSL